MLFFRIGADRSALDNMGQDEGQGTTMDDPKHPRGIQGYSLVGGGNFTSWKVQGKLGGNVECVRSPRSRSLLTYL